MRLEPELWDARDQICQREGIGVGELIRQIEAKGDAGGRTSAVRVHVLQYPSVKQPHRKGTRRQVMAARGSAFRCPLARPDRI